MYLTRIAKRPSGSGRCSAQFPLRKLKNSPILILTFKMAGSFYRDPPNLLSQGDIVRDVPWGLIEAPTTLCRPIDRKKPNGDARYSAVDPWVMKNASGPWSRNPEIIHAVGWQDAAMVLWHDCQIDKSENQERSRPEKEFAAVAPIHSLDSLRGKDANETENFHRGVRAGEHHSYFHLPAVTAGDFVLGESYVNFRYIWSVRQSSLTNRPVSLHPDMLLSLYDRLFVFFTRFRLDVKLSCPSCGTPVPLVRTSDGELGN